MYLSYRRSVCLATILLVAILSFSGCGGGVNTTVVNSSTGSNLDYQESSSGTLPVALPVDRVQPWETVSEAGYVVADSGGRSGSMLDIDGGFTPGVEWFSTGVRGVATHFNSGLLNSGYTLSEGLSWVQYRLLLEGIQPGVVALDVNPRPDNYENPSDYYVGLADYAAGTWEWHGPFNGNHVRLNTREGVAAGADYLSSLGNLFVVVLAWDSSKIAVVGVAANPDGVPCPAIAPPANLTARPITGGLALTWDAVTDDNLAGYQVYWSRDDFSTPADDGVQAESYLIHRCEHVLPVAGPSPVHVRVASVDLNGEVSGISDTAMATPGEGASLPVMMLETTRPSCLVEDAVTLTAQGMGSYDWDLDGDGVYEVENDTTGTQALDTSGSGVLRPAIRGRITSNGNWVACQGVSVFVTENEPPVAVAHADPASGQAPLVVTFTGEGSDNDGHITSYAWDFDGDGTYDYSSTTDPDPDPYTFTTAGIHDVRFRVYDNSGAYDVDTVSISVTEADNVAPVADLVTRSDLSGNAPHYVSLDARDSTDSDGEIVEYQWDFDGDGTYDETTTEPTNHYTYDTSGYFEATVMVVDDEGATDTASIFIDVNEGPVAVLNVNASEGDAPFLVSFDAGDSYDDDGWIIDYSWSISDSENNNYTAWSNANHGNPTAQYTFEANVYTVRLYVTDNDHVTNSTSVTITSRGWGYKKLAASLTELIPCGFDEVWEDVGVLYKEGQLQTTGPLKYMTHRKMYPFAYQITTTVLSDAASCSHLSFRAVNYCPALAYHDSALGKLMYMQSPYSDGSEWSIVAELADLPGGTDQIHLAQVHDRAAVAYTNGDYLMFVRSTISNGSTWGTPVVVNDAGVTGYDLEPCSLEVIDGYPAMSLYDTDEMDLYFIRALNEDGTAWGTPVKVLGDGIGTAVGTMNSLTEVDGAPAILAFPGHDGTLSVSYIRATNAAGTAWGAPDTLYSDADMYGWAPSLQVMNGVPWASLRGDDGYSRVCEAQDAQGLGWGSPQIATWPSVQPDYFFMSHAYNRMYVLYDHELDTGVYQLRMGYIVE